MPADAQPIEELTIATPPGLSTEQLTHFAEHGWVVQEAAFTPAECADFRAALNRRLGEINKNVWQL